MMSDHETLSRVRNELADALKCLLKAEIMTDTDFRSAHYHASFAIECLDVLLRQSNRD
jgi:hypothetical protein